MRIGIDASRASVQQKTGTENYSYSLISALANIDRQNTYQLYLRNKIDFPFDKYKNFSALLIKLPRLWTQLGLASQMVSNPPDVLFVPAHTLPVIRNPRIKTVVTIHDLGYEYLEQYHKFPGSLYLNKSTEYAASSADHLIAVSDATKQDLIKKLGVSPEKVTVVYEGFDAENFKKVAATEVKRVKDKYKIVKDYLLFVGTIQPRKNLENLIKAYAQSYKKIDCDLVISGKSGWQNREIYDLPRKLNIEDRIKFLGFTPNEDLPGLYSGAKAFVYPSLFEGFGLPLLEAFACGTPVLTSNVSSLPEVSGGAALLVDPYDIDSISRGIYQIVSDEKLRKDLVNKGKERLKDFSWEKAARETLAVFEKVYNSK